MARQQRIVAIAFFCLLGAATFCAGRHASSQPDPFGGSEITGSGWHRSDWFGFYNADFCPWINQREHGWMLLAESEPDPQGDSVWMWTPDFGWIWTNSAIYPFLFRSADQAWLFYYREPANPRWFLNLNTLRSESPDPVRILALGDSYTIGESVAESGRSIGESVAESGRWPVQFANLLRERGLTVEGPRIIARTGWTTTEMLLAVESADLTPPYELVTLLIGVNDQFRGLSLEGYRENFATALDRAIELAGGDRNRVIVLSIPDYAVTPFARAFGLTGIGPMIDAFNEANFSITEAAGVHYIDVTPDFAQGGDGSNLYRLRWPPSIRKHVCGVVPAGASQNGSGVQFAGGNATVMLAAGFGKASEAIAVRSSKTDLIQ